MRLTSAAFEEGGTIPVQHTGDGPDLSPPLAWGEPPAGTQAFALVVVDPDAPGGTFTHWLVWNLPPSLRALTQDVPRVRNLPDGAKQGLNGYGAIGWGGPAPPPGRTHRYVFELCALDGRLLLGAGASCPEVLRALDGHVLARGCLSGRYGRPPMTTFTGAPRQR